MTDQANHVPVLLEETTALLGPALDQGGWLVDCTVGAGGHAHALMQRFPDIRLLAFDRDPRALELARQRLAEYGQRVRFEHGPFGELEASLQRAGFEGVRGILADLGVSSMQLDVAERGFSFQHDGPLDMRMAGDSGDSDLTAADIVNSYPEEEMADIFRQYGEERHARRIARGIAAARSEAPLSTTGELAGLVARLAPGHPAQRHRRHPATRVFQALRIEVNRELDELRELIDQATRMLEQDGRLVVISYHSLEDRIVKHGLRDLATGEVEPVTGRPRAETQVLEVLTRKPVRPSDGEVNANPRSRSARLRAARRL